MRKALRDRDRDRAKGHGHGQQGYFACVAPYADLVSEATRKGTNGCTYSFTLFGRKAISACGK